MHLHSLQVGSFEVNCSILDRGGEAWIVDPGQESERILAVLQEHRLMPAGILLTHAHFDHIGAVGALQKAYPSLPVYVHPADVPAFTHPMNQYPPDYPPVTVPANLKDPRELTWLTVVETPGHTPGGVSYYLPEEKLLFSGDTLFLGSVGRTDLPGGDPDTLMASLKRLVALPEETKVIPGHGGSTFIGTEKRINPFLG